MSNLLEQAINCDDGDRAAKIIRDALGIKATMWSTTAFRRNGQPIVNSAPGTSAVAEDRGAVSGLVVTEGHEKDGHHPSPCERPGKGLE